MMEEAEYQQYKAKGDLNVVNNPHGNSGDSTKQPINIYMPPESGQKLATMIMLILSVVLQLLILIVLGGLFMYLHSIDLSQQELIRGSAQEIIRFITPK